MIKEAYCSYEVSELLKKKGFDEECTHYYSYEDDELIEYTNGVYSRNSKDCHRCTSPTLQMACAWLREVHNKHCDIGYDIDLEWYFQIIDLKQTAEYDYPEMKIYHAENSTGFNSYEDAVEAALKYSLENLL